MSDGITHVGLDAHQETIVVAALLPGTQAPVEDRLANAPETVARWVRRLRSRSAGEVVCAYEAGPLGYGLMRQLEALGVSCVVVAPALIPIKPGDRIKTDRRDARKLAELLRVSDHRERQDRAIVNTQIGIVNAKIGHGEHLDRAS